MCAPCSVCCWIMAGAGGVGSDELAARVEATALRSSLAQGVSRCHRRTIYQFNSIVSAFCTEGNTIRLCSLPYEFRANQKLIYWQIFQRYTRLCHDKTGFIIVFCWMTCDSVDFVCDPGRTCARLKRCRGRANATTPSACQRFRERSARSPRKSGSGYLVSQRLPRKSGSGYLVSQAVATS